jgi:hypothetical protein
MEARHDGRNDNACDQAVFQGGDRTSINRQLKQCRYIVDHMHSPPHCAGLTLENLRRYYDLPLVIAAGRADSPGMTWDIRFSRDDLDHLESYPTAESAIEAACLLIDQGCEVHGIWTGQLTEAIDREQIIRIYSLRIKPRP